LADQQTQAYEKFYVVWGRKPEVAVDVCEDSGSQSTLTDETIAGIVDGAG